MDEQQRPTALQTWIKWRLIVGAIMGPVLLVWAMNSDPTIPAIIAGVLIATRLGTDVVLFVRRHRGKRSVNHSAPTPDAESESN